MHASAPLTAADVLEAQHGDRTAFARLVDATRSVVDSIALAIVRDPHASQDIAQEVFLEAWAKVSTLRNPESFLPWIRQVTRNLAHEHLRARGRFGRRHATWEPVLAEGIADERGDAASALLDVERCRVLNEALESLPEETREVVTLFYREDRSARQVALLLDLSEEAVKKRLQRARATLAEELIARFDAAARDTAPGAAFSAAIAAAIAVAAPASASATTLGLAAAKATFATGALAAAVAGPAAGALSGVLGVRLGIRRAIADAYDERERTELHSFARKATIVIVLGEVIFLVAALLGFVGVSHVAVATYVAVDYVVLVGLLAYLYLRKLPAILARGRALRLTTDPSLVSRFRREDLARIAGVAFGALCGAVGLAVGLYFLLA